MIRKVLICGATAVLATAVACSKSTSNPASPSTTTQTDAGAAADGSTLKASTPAIVSPSGGGQVVDPITLTASKAVGKYGDIAASYQFQVRSGSNVVYDSGVVSGSVSGNNVSQAVPSSALNPDTDYTWRVRASYQGAVGSWSGDGTFRSPVGAYMRPGELRDPLTIGRTVGQPTGSVTFNSEGATINDQTSFIAYNMGAPVTVGEFSMMAKNIKSAAPGGKSKMMAIQQGFEDPTTNPYRFTIEKRGSAYPEPGATTCRIITGNPDRNSSSVNIFDCDRATVNYDPSHWYLWSVTWGNGVLRLTVTDTNAGRVVYTNQQKIGSRPYSPNPMVAFVGAPVGRAGPDDASVPRITVKNVWLSANPRPTFPN